MQRFYVKFAFLMLSLEMAFSGETKSTTCPLYTWQCNNGECIKFEELCDGNYDCEDKSDETVDECLLRPCPSYAFQCAYGACITGNFKCDGIVNCVDGSDETRFLCTPKINYEEEIQGHCTFPFSFQCKSGECINNERLCDGKDDCRDGSDETVEMCSFLKCPEYSFRCGYGACVAGVAACNGYRDCKDGSDEINSICSNITSAITPTTTTTSIIIPDSSHTTTLRPTLSTSTVTTTTELPYQSDNSCSSSVLSRGISAVATCRYNERNVSCLHGIRPGTIANVACAPGYVGKNMKSNSTRIQCDFDGEWTRSKIKCTPECGILTEAQKNSPTKPWEVTIFRRTYAPTYEPICSGVIVSPKIVLTAGSCFMEATSGYNTDHVFYNIIEGYYNVSYSSEQYLNAVVHNLSSISIKNIHRMQDLAVLVLVNYFQFSELLKPICLPTAQSNIFPYYADSKLNIGRPVMHDTSKTYLEYLIASVEDKPNGLKTLAYVNVYHYVPFINREIKKYDYLL